MPLVLNIIRHVVTAIYTLPLSYTKYIKVADISLLFCKHIIYIKIYNLTLVVHIKHKILKYMSFTLIMRGAEEWEIYFASHFYVLSGGVVAKLV